MVAITSSSFPWWGFALLGMALLFLIILGSVGSSAPTVTEEAAGEDCHARSHALLRPALVRLGLLLDPRRRARLSRAAHSTLIECDDDLNNFLSCLSTRTWLVCLYDTITFIVDTILSDRLPVLDWQWVIDPGNQPAYGVDKRTLD